ncbi:hypothetical protein ACVWXO_000791 [Bradyrhizobium sp. LM2.7]
MFKKRLHQAPRHFDLRAIIDAALAEQVLGASAAEHG